jgi:hypothetical protein
MSGKKEKMVSCRSLCTCLCRRRAVEQKNEKQRGEGKKGLRSLPRLENEGMAGGRLQ